MTTWVGAPVSTITTTAGEDITAILPTLPPVLNQAFNPAPASGANTDGTDVFSTG